MDKTVDLDHAVRRAVDEALASFDPEDGLVELRPLIGAGLRQEVLAEIVRRVAVEPDPVDRDDLLALFYFLHAAPQWSWGANNNEARPEMLSVPEPLAEASLTALLHAALAEETPEVLASYVSTLESVVADVRKQPRTAALFVEVCRRLMRLSPADAYAQHLRRFVPGA